MKLRNFKYNNLPKTKFRCAYAQLFRLIKACYYNNIASSPILVVFQSYLKTLILTFHIFKSEILY